MAESVKEIAAAIRAFNAGKPLEALRHLDGGSGSLARKLAPLPGDDQIERNEQADALRGKIGAATEQGALQADLLKELEERGDKDGAKRLREAMDANSRHLKELESTLQKLIEQGATVSKSSAEGDGPFGGARIRSAAFTGGGGFRRLGGMGGGASLPGGGSGPGYTGEQGERGAMRERFREHLKRTVPGYDGGDTVPIGPGGRIPPMTGAGVPTGSDAGSLTALIERESQAAGIDSGWMQGIRAGESGHRHNRGNPRGAYDHNPGTPGRPEDSWGPFQLNRLRGLGQNFQRETGLDLSDPRTIPAQVRWVARYLRKQLDKNPRYSPFPTWQGFHGKRAASPTWGDSGYVPEGATASRTPPIADRSRTGSEDLDFFPNGAPRVLKPNSMKDAPGITMDEANRLRSGRADGEGWAAREKARKEFEAKMRAGEARLDRSVGRAGVMGGSKVEANGSVSIVVQKPGPETNVRTSASGNLFKDVVMQRGRPMARAEGG